MPYADLPLDQLRGHLSESVEPADFDAFWAGTLSEARAHGEPPAFTRVDSGLSLIETYDVRFPGFKGQPIAGWLHLPAGTTQPLPCVVQYIGYGGGRGLAHENTLWAAAGFATLVMDTRGQGSHVSVGVTPDPEGSGPAYAGVMTRGIGDPHTYYYRRLVTDAVRAVDAARAHPLVDPARIAVAGASQGGGLTIAAAALAGDVAAALPDVPFLCDFPRATWIVDKAPYDEIVHYGATHRDQAGTIARTLSYVDGVHFAARATAPALFSVALMDPTCPPSTVYAAYNAWAGSKQVREYRFNGHEGGGAFHTSEQLSWLSERLCRG
ncbi:acetylxylan esterase [Actinacidiphila bryophytorum]|uniref:Cephalosporin-C deacetylase n=1 Tax=Actinacidiphila bryophytorum TaxID=1436133 RepID=A0A9W4MGT6_9ACTN|nr:acetylxylan esterase [Actinacidiphila bryophytorum]MBM9437007.1 acetylxylan esterase [Actinacidiphila bryophytorum]MBN6544715.1 acetylxylan esterase [Actinacidiphila bryophytorum]CAG7646200.1 Cephalosporin-C deacetylase [Actinacidiphila bryophytorum]